MPLEWDLIVVGGGPGGAAVAATAAAAGLETLLLERGGTLRHKPCGGILPEITEELIEEVFGAPLPPEVLAEQGELRLRYTPPSGEANGGRVRESRLLNVKRDHFDQWLRDRAALAGATVQHDARVSDVEANGGFSISYSQRGKERQATAAQLVGGDGVHSLVRRRLAPDAAAPKMLVGQRLVRVAGELPADFHCVFAGMLSPFYAYTVPKGGLLKIGSGMTEEERTDLMPSLDRFSEWLEQNGIAKLGEVVQQEGWAIPFGEPRLDAAGALLVGDAAGLCNPLSGEGIRLAIESGQLAAEAIIESGARSPVQNYREGVAGIAQMVAALHRIVLATDDETREKFVAAELARP
ncbi:MAG: NAD(P)/FAD-dependent oxidoreductase [Candidatus Poseidoniia archaeon]|nr:NAD(P)/FAD-dependent oxidoreductase [Candidatus Poseidoniia archaeon]MDP6846735.1 NAD(P)/FAD-dependent oxidoreductase [Candidatus Poseidoniia archaeon]